MWRPSAPSWRWLDLSNSPDKVNTFPEFSELLSLSCRLIATAVRCSPDNGGRCSWISWRRDPVMDCRSVERQSDSVPFDRHRWIVTPSPWLPRPPRDVRSARIWGQWLPGSDGESSSRDLRWRMTAYIVDVTASAVWQQQHINIIIIVVIIIIVTNGNNQSGIWILIVQTGLKFCISEECTVLYLVLC